MKLFILAETSSFDIDIPFDYKKKFFSDDGTILKVISEILQGKIRKGKIPKNNQYSNIDAVILYFDPKNSSRKLVPCINPHTLRTKEINQILEIMEKCIAM